jgi:GT2 family glycosyltransferase
MTLHIFTLTWNAAEKITRLYNSLIPALDGIEYVWYIKDNNSTDNTNKIIPAWTGNINYIQYKDNLQNFSQGNNHLYSIAAPKDNDAIMLLNNDVSFGDTVSIRKMLNHLKDDVGIVGAKLLFTDTNKIQHCGVVFTNKHKLPIHYRSGEEDDINSSKNRYFQAVTGAAMIMKAEDYRSICTTNKSGINGLCEELIWCFDDIDACNAIHINNKKKILYCGDTKIFHDESASLKKNPINRLFLGANVRYFTNKWKGRYIIDAPLYVADPNYNVVK